MKQPHSCSDAELYEGIDRSHAIVSEIHRGLLRFIREFDKRELWKHDGCRNMGEWLAGRLGISYSEGLRRTQAAHALEELPLISSALEDGTLSLDKATLLARFATPTTEKDLLRWARRATVSALWRKAEVMKRQSRDETRSAHANRYLSWWFNDDSTLSLQGMLPSEQGATFAKAIDRLASKVPETPDEDYDRDRKRADALVAMASGHIAVDPDADRATVVVHAPLPDLLIEASRLPHQQGEASGVEIEGGPVIHRDIARRMSCHCRLQTILHGEGGAVIGIGRTSRKIPPSLWRALIHRDGGCTFCGTKRFLDGHHIVHWEDGGPTNIDNLVVVCRFHHDLIHKFGWRVELDHQQVARWYRPDGQRYAPGPRRTGMRTGSETFEIDWSQLLKPSGDPVEEGPELQLAGFA